MVYVQAKGGIITAENEKFHQVNRLTGTTTSNHPKPPAMIRAFAFVGKSLLISFGGGMLLFKDFNDWRKESGEHAI